MKIDIVGLPSPIKTGDGSSFLFPFLIGKNCSKSYYSFRGYTVGIY